jgi:release factor glutamine methyltransferase
MYIKETQIRTAYEYIKKELAAIYSDREIYSLSYLILEEILKIPKHEIMLDPSARMSAEQSERFTGIVQQLKEGNPVQYILGYTYFCDLKLRINPPVLIPRPETEELVYWIIEKEHKPVPVIADIGTGSGCIALALKNHFPESTVYALDASPGALAIAGENASLCDLRIQLILNDILTDELTDADVFADLIVSNPPYVRESEKSMLEQRIIAHEPHEALFVPDNDPLIYYKAIIRQSAKILKPGGRVYFEIHELAGKEMLLLLENSDFQSVMLKKDINGKDRLITAINKY